MFNKEIHVHNKSHAVPYEKTVKEYRAPTDESISLYSEMKEKALKSILWQHQIPGNTFKGVITKSIEPYTVHLCFVLNNKKHKVSAYINPLSEKRIVEQLCDAISDYVASVILSEIGNIKEFVSCNDHIG
jgi:hypothetical protein